MRHRVLIGACAGAGGDRRGAAKVVNHVRRIRFFSTGSYLCTTGRSCDRSASVLTSSSSSSSSSSSLCPLAASFAPVAIRHQQTRNMTQTNGTTNGAGGRRALTVDNINQNIVKAKYAVRGELPTRSEKYRQQIKEDGQGSLPFDNVISANIGNPQQLDQKPITFFRQVLSLLEYPALMDNADVLTKSLGYKEDAIARAKHLLSEIGSVGAYSQSQGAPVVRKSVAEFIERRDGYSADWTHIFLSGGASSAVNTLMNTICATPNVGILIPIPQYPLYTASLSVLNAKGAPYYLDESKDWSLDVKEIENALSKARSEGTDVKAIVVINPGNPTGASLPPQDIEAVLKLAARERLVVIGDEVYQTNIFKGDFTSFKKGLRNLQKANPGEYDHVELASLHSTSKGMIGECGHRGGYVELVGFDEDVVAQMSKFISIQLCPPVMGQCMTELMVNPPRPGDASHEQYQAEYDGIFKGLQERATALYKSFSEMEGYECSEPQGAMYLFPTIKLPQKAQDAAKKEERSSDEFYCSKLLDATGICVVPGSGFGQRENTLHFRTTFLPPGTDWVGRFTSFHKKFMDEYR